MHDTISAVAGIVTAIIGLAIVAVLVSSNAQTGSVITSASQGLSGIIGAAVAPVSGGSTPGWGSATQDFTAG